MGSFPGFLRTEDNAGFEIWNDPARPVTAHNTNPRFGSTHYRVMGGHFMFADERLVPPRHHENIDNLNVPGKTMWMHCGDVAWADYGLWAGFINSYNGTDGHNGAVNLSFVDGHAEANPFAPVAQWWLATGGVAHFAAGTPAEYGDRAYVYPPLENNATAIAGAQWWIPPHYPEAPIYNCQ